MPFIKSFFDRFNDRGVHLLTVDIWEQPLSVGRSVAYVKQTRNNVYYLNLPLILIEVQKYL